MTLVITDRDGSAVFENTLLGLLSDGRHEVVWDGRNGDGNSVLSGVYIGSVELNYEKGGRDHAVHKIAVLN